MDIEFVNILTGEVCSEFWLLILTSFMFHPVVRRGWGKEGGWGISLF